MDNCKNCAGTIGKDDVCQYCGTYHGPQKINTSSFREPEVEHVQYGGLTAFGKIIVALSIIMIVFTINFVSTMDKKTPAIKSGLILPSTAEMLGDSTHSNHVTAIMGDGDWNLAQEHMASWNIPIYTTGASTGEDKIIK